MKVFTSITPIGRLIRKVQTARRTLNRQTAIKQTENIKSDKKLKYLFVLFIFGINLGYSQDRSLTMDSDTVKYSLFRYFSDLSSEIGIPTIDKSPEKYELRFWDGQKLIRLWSVSDSLKAEAIYFIRKFSKKDRFTANRYGDLHVKRDALNERTIQAIEYLISDFDVLQIPQEEQVEGWRWKRATTGTRFYIATCSVDSFSFKNYGARRLEFEELRKIKYFYSQLHELEEIDEGFRKFVKNQPFKVYYSKIRGARKGFSSSFVAWWHKFVIICFIK